MKMGVLACTKRKIGINRGQMRIWMEGRGPARAGFLPGSRFSIRVHDERRAVVIRLDPEGTRVVSRKGQEGSLQPVIDINSTQLLKPFEGQSAVRVMVMEGEIWILPLAFEVKRRERIERMRAEVNAGVISTATAFHGAGVMSDAIHEGLRESGLVPNMKWAVEMEESYLDIAFEGSSSWSDETKALALPLQELAFGDDYLLGRLDRVSLFEAGIPCTASSSAGRAKKHLRSPEDDAKAGHLVAALLVLIARSNPFGVLFECVVNYSNSASAAILRTQLTEMGYDLHEMVIEGKDYALENRRRWVMVGITSGYAFDLAAFVAPPRAIQCVRDILDPIQDDSEEWSSMAGLKEKEKRDIAAGKGFRMVTYAGDETAVNCVTAGYARRRSTDPKLQHPTKPDLLRQFTVAEHARLKGIPERLLAAAPGVTLGHQILGQSVIWPAFKHAAHFVGQALQRMANVDPVVDDRPPAFALTS